MSTLNLLSICLVDYIYKLFPGYLLSDEAGWWPGTIYIAI